MARGAKDADRERRTSSVPSSVTLHVGCPLTGKRVRLVAALKQINDRKGASERRLGAGRVLCLYLGGHCMSTFSSYKFIKYTFIIVYISLHALYFNKKCLLKKKSPNGLISKSSTAY